MFRITHLCLITAAGLCSCATERTVTNSLETRNQKSMDLMDRFAGGFSVQKDKDGEMKMVSEKRSSFEGRRYGGEISSVEKKALETSGFEKKQFDGAGTRFETKKWDGTKSFMDGKTEVPDFIAHAKGVNTGTWQDATKQYAMRKAEIQGRTWKEADKQFGHEINRDIDAKRKNFEQPSMMSIREAQAHTIQETREMMGRTD